MTLIKKAGTMRLALLVAVVGLLVPNILSAADVYETQVVASVPFEFIVAGETMQPGTYQVDVGPGAAEKPILVIQTAAPESKGEMKFKKVMTMAVPTKEAEGKAKLIFKRVGDLYFLEKVNPGEGTVKKLK